MSDECAEVLETVYAYIDGELTPEDCDRIKRHLDDCGPCLRRFGVEQEVKALVARSCGCEQAPAQLRERVVARLRAACVEITGGDGGAFEVRTTTEVVEVTDARGRTE